MLASAYLSALGVQQRFVSCPFLLRLLLGQLFAALLSMEVQGWTQGIRLFGKYHRPDFLHLEGSVSGHEVRHGGKHTVSGELNLG